MLGVVVVVSLGARFVFDVGDDRRVDAPGSDPHRPVVHFSGASDWVGAPTGAVVVDGRHHLFFQHNPTGSVLGDIGWGHAVSDDTITWEEQEMALEATERSMALAGSVVHDHDDTSARCQDRQPCLAALFTAASTDPASGELRHDVHLATSNGGGDTWVEHDRNPVLSPEVDGIDEVRDPDVFWHVDSSAWVMTVARPDTPAVGIYRSDDLIDWEHASDSARPG